MIPNICNIQPIINIESQILAVMQHYNKKYSKEIKHKKNELTKQKADEFDAEDKKDQNREASGQNESGQTNDKGDTTNSNEKKDSKEGQKTSE